MTRRPSARSLRASYGKRGIEPLLAQQVAVQLMAHDALGAHARDELGLSETLAARPLQAAIASAITFAVGAALPLILIWFGPPAFMVSTVAAGSLVFLAFLGALAARAGGANMSIGAARVTLWGALAMAATAGVGRIFSVMA